MTRVNGRLVTVVRRIGDDRYLIRFTDTRQPLIVPASMIDGDIPDLDGWTD